MASPMCRTQPQVRRSSPSSGFVATPTGTSNIPGFFAVNGDETHNIFTSFNSAYKVAEADLLDGASGGNDFPQERHDLLQDGRHLHHHRRSGADEFVPARRRPVWSRCRSPALDEVANTVGIPYIGAAQPAPPLFFARNLSRATSRPASSPMTQPPLTYSSAHIRRQREVHAKINGYGRHRHLYLHDTIRRLATRPRQQEPAGQLNWLTTAACKGGSIIEQIRPLGLVHRHRRLRPCCRRPSRPARKVAATWVTCLDVLDKGRDRSFVDAVLADIAGLTGHLAIFDHLTLPKHESGLDGVRTLPFYWTQFIRRHMDVIETNVEFPGMQDFERAVIVAAPRGTASVSTGPQRGGQDNHAFRARPLGDLVRR